MRTSTKLTANTIKRIERLGFTVGDSGGKKWPYVLTSPYGPAMSGNLSDDELYLIANVLEFVVSSGGIVERSA